MLLTTKIQGLDKAVAQLADVAGRCGNLSKPLMMLGLHHQRKARRILRSGERGIQSRNPAGLAASITFAQSSPNELLVGSNKVYAASQQFGPAGGYYESSRPNGMLAIPIMDNLGARGNARFSSPRDVADGFFFRSKTGKVFFGRRIKKERKPRAARGNKKPVWGSQVARPDDSSLIEVLFLLVLRSKGTAHRYVTHDPDDQKRWDRFAANWMLRGT